MSSEYSASIGSCPCVLMPSLIIQYKNPMNTSNRKMPSARPRVWSGKSRTGSTLTASITGNSRLKVWERTASGCMMAAKPMTRPILAILDPRALPIARCGAPCNAAVAETRISGAEVANPTTVKPTSIGETPMLLAATAAPTTIRSAPQINNPNPASIDKTYKSIRADYNGLIRWS